MESFADILYHLSPYKYKNLISTRCFHKLVQVYGLFPPWISHAFGFETELGRNKAAVDTAFCIGLKNLEKSALPDVSLLRKTELLSDLFWQSIEKFISLWQKKDGDVNAFCKNTWFTFDLDRIKSNKIFPGVYIGVKEEKYQSRDKIFEIIHFIYSMFIHFNYLTQWGEYGDIISRCFTRIPLSGFVNYVGFMPGRSKDIVRVSVLFNEPAAIPQYLDDIRIDKKVSRDFFSVIQKYISYCDYNILHFDIGKEIKPGIGVELRYASRELHLFSQYRWKPVLERLRRDRLCNRGKEKGLELWPGMENGSLKAGGHDYTVFRFLYYIKLIYVPEKPLKAKAYFGYVFHPEKT